MHTLTKPTLLDRSISERLKINAKLRVRYLTRFSESCDACLMADLMRMTAKERIEHADWYSTGPVDTTVMP